jgi:hypothetical protein
MVNAIQGGELAPALPFLVFVCWLLPPVSSACFFRVKPEIKAVAGENGGPRRK